MVVIDKNLQGIKEETSVTLFKILLHCLLEVPEEYHKTLTSAFRPEVKPEAFQKGTIFSIRNFHFNFRILSSCYSVMYLPSYVNSLFQRWMP
jgi:hypothetical protein